MKTYKQVTVSNTVWATPWDFFNRLNRVFRFTLDVCALKENAKCESFYSPEEDGLAKDWLGGVWCNPPYGKDITAWVRKASEEITKDYCDFIVMLLPARTDTLWFHSYVYGKARVEFVKGRIRFGNSNMSAPFPSMLAIYFKEVKYND